MKNTIKNKRHQKFIIRRNKNILAYLNFPKTPNLEKSLFKLTNRFTTFTMNTIKYIILHIITHLP